MGPQFDIIGMGTVFIDDLLTVDEYPPADQKTEVREETRAFGGCIGTGLAAAARLGAACAYAGALGKDSLSASMREGFADAGVDTSLVIDVDGATPGHSVIIADRTHGTRNIFYNMAGCTPLKTYRVTDDLIGACKVLMVDHFGPDAAFKAVSTARRLGKSVVSDFEWTDHPHLFHMLAFVDHMIASVSFAEAVTGESDPAKAVRRLHGMHSVRRACTAVTCGADGVYFLTADSVDVTHQPAFKVKTVETTGCGDVFHGAYAAALAAGSPVPECIRFAAAAAAVYAGRPSGWKYLATKGDVRGIMAAP